MKAIQAAVISICLAGAVEQSIVPAQNAAKSAAVFEDIPPRQSGITWVHDNAMSPARHLPETTGSGCAFFDYDNDGWMDVYLVNSGAADFVALKAPLKNALYRNNHDGTFTDVTEKAGVAGGRFGMGVAAGDYNNDGRQDLYVTNYGRNFLFRNNGDGTFTDVAREAGVEAPGWSTAAVWFDADGDSRLDLFVSSYVHYEPGLSRLCHDEQGRARYCIPKLFQPTPSRLFRNNGDGTFADISAQSGIAGAPGKAFGAVATDIDNDGKPDLFVANDMVANFLFLNKGAGTFEEIGLWAGVGYSEAGAPRSGMGVDANDFDGDGWQDLFVSNVDHQRFSLYRNQRDMTFTEHGGEVQKATFLLSGWGLRFFDYDNDGDCDLFLANGHPDDKVAEVNPRVTYKEPLYLFKNEDANFRDISAEAGPVFNERYPARGLATGDYDNDGAIDILISNNGEAPVLLRNNGARGNNWLGVNLVATKSNPAAVGAVITWTAAGTKRARYKTGGGSYMSYHDPREILGLGKATRLESLEVRWPGGVVDTFSDLPVNRYMQIKEGQTRIQSAHAAE
jgi:hypothetical protein